MISTLTSDHFAIWKALRLEAISLHPQAFGESYDETSKLTEEKFKKSLETSVLLAHRVSEDITGVVGCYSLLPYNMRHKGVLFGLYVRPEYRRQGVANSLLYHVIEYAKNRYTQIHLSVTTHNTDAIALYRKHGFTIYGTEPRALLIDRIYYDEHHMVKLLHA